MQLQPKLLTTKNGKCITKVLRVGFNKLTNRPVVAGAVLQTALSGSTLVACQCFCSLMCHTGVIHISLCTSHQLLQGGQHDRSISGYIRIYGYFTSYNSYASYPSVTLALP